MSTEILRATARALVADGKGLLAADESLPTIGRRFESVDLISTPETRRAYRSMLLTTPGLERFISGVILYKETLDQQTDDGSSLVGLLEERGIVPGVKVDCGTAALPLSGSEKFTEGLYGLRERLEAYRDKGARFAKWRAVFSVGEDCPSDYCIAANAHNLACYAAFCQEAGLVPVVEPELLMQGDHDLQRCEFETGRILERLFTTLREYRIDLGGLLLKTHMVVPGADCRVPAGAEEIAQATNRCLARHVPEEVPGIVFLSGGLAPEVATTYLHAVTDAAQSQPWILSFSFGRALQDPALKLWRGHATRVAAAQEALYRRAEYNAAAVRGFYNPRLERTA